MNAIREIGDTRSASLFFYLAGGAIGEVPVFASISGYGDSVEEAIITGGCNWSSVFGPVLEAALADGDPGEAERFEAVIHGRRYNGVIDGLDRAMSYGDDPGSDI